MKIPSKRLRRAEDGFTLAELLVTITMLTVVLFSLYGIFDMSLKVFSLGNDKLEAVENARVGLEKMQREIRAAYPVYATAGGDPYLFFEANGATANPLKRTALSATQITFGNELGSPGDGIITCPNASNCEYITYKLSGNTLVRNATVTGSTSNSGDQPVIDSVNLSGPNDGLKFEYLNDSGNATTNQNEIDRVRISLDVLVEGGERDGTQTLKTEVELRNKFNPTIPTDTDGDGVPDDSDACPTQAGTQANGCPADDDGDGVPNASDNCPAVSNASQADLDSDGIGDACDDDRDGDGVPNATDECPDSANPGDGCPATSLSVNDVSITEGNTGTNNLVFTVARSGNLARTTTVKYATANGTATSGSDYTATSGTLTFASGESSKTVNVAIVGDKAVEPNEIFYLNLSDATRGTITRAQGVGTITNDDVAPKQCADGVDNGPRPDGKIDFGTGTSNDKGCSSATDDSENQRPTATAKSGTLTNNQGRAISFSGVLNNDTDTDGDALTVSAYTQPVDSGGTRRGSLTVNSSGSASYTPPNSTYTGTVTFTYTCSDGKGGTDTATITLKIVR